MPRDTDEDSPICSAGLFQSWVVIDIGYCENCAAGEGTSKGHSMIQFAHTNCCTGNPKGGEAMVMPFGISSCMMTCPNIDSNS